MTQHTKLEQALDDLGGVIGADGSMADGVTERIDRLPHRPLNDLGATRRWMCRLALIIVGGLVGLAAGWYVPHESADAAAPLDRTGEPSPPADALGEVVGKAPVMQRDGHFFVTPKPPEAHVVAAGNEEVLAPGAVSVRLMREDGSFFALGGIEEMRRTVKSGRSWGPEQATGFPDTPKPGDFPTAWASKTRDEQAEWLELTYPKAVQPMYVLVFESYNPGAVHKVSVFDKAGKEAEVWTGKDPTSATGKSGVSVIRFTSGFKVDRVRIYVDSARIDGWNEIDAVGLIDTSGGLQWASRATASSTYAMGEPPVPQSQRTAELMRRLERLEEMVRKLRKELEEIKK